MLKPILSFLAFVLMTSQASAVNVISIKAGRAAVGDTGRFYIAMQNDVPVNGLNFVLKCETGIITLIGISPVGRAAMMNRSCGYQYAKDEISFLVYDQLGGNIEPDTGSIFEVKFMAKDSLSADTTVPLSFISGIAADSNRAVIPFDYAGGAILLTDVKSTTGLSNLPTEYTLYQNYPNPFNPTSTIRFDVPVATVADLRIFNILGQLVMTVFEHRGFSPGRHETKLEAAGLASGVYFYRLEAKSQAGPPRTFRRVGKMVLIR